MLAPWRAGSAAKTDNAIDATYTPMQLLISMAIIGFPFPVGENSINSQALLHCVALIPNIDVECCQLVDPFRRQGVHALDGDTVDIVVKQGPRIRLVQGVDFLAKRRCLEGLGRSSFKVVHELKLQLDIVMRPNPADMTANKGLKRYPVDLFDLRKIAGNIFRERKAAPGHPAGGKRHLRPSALAVLVR